MSGSERRVERVDEDMGEEEDAASDEDIRLYFEERARMRGAWDAV